MIDSLFTFDAIGVWVTVTVLLIHLVALRSDIWRLVPRARSSAPDRPHAGHYAAVVARVPLALHAVACVGMALAHRLDVFLIFAVVAIIPFLVFFELGNERHGSRLDLFTALGCVAVVAIAAECAVAQVGEHVRQIGRALLLPGLLLGLAARLGMWPFGRWLESPHAVGREVRLALTLSGGAAWVAFVRHLPSTAVASTPHAELIAGAFVASAVVMALSVGRSSMPIADVARAHVAVAVAAGLLLMGTHLIVDYSFAALAGAAAISLVLAGNVDTSRGLYALEHHDHWLLAILVVLCAGCPATAIFVDQDLVLEGTAFAHPLVAVAIAVVFVAAAVALMRFFFERTMVAPGVRHRVTGTWLVPALLSLGLVLWGMAPAWLDPATDDSTVESVDR